MASKTKTGNTMHIIPTLRYATGLILVALALLAVRTASADDLTSDSRRALQQLVAQNPAAAKANSKALAVLVFPNVVKAGFVVGAHGGKGILFVHGQPAAAIVPSLAPMACRPAYRNTGTHSSS